MGTRIACRKKSVGGEAEKDRRLATVLKRRMIKRYQDRATVTVDEQLAAPEDVASCPAVLARRVTGAKLRCPIQPSWPK